MKLYSLLFFLLLIFSRAVYSSNTFINSLEDGSFKAPDVMMFDENNKCFIIESFLNKFVLVHFWATWSMEYGDELRKIANMKFNLEREGFSGFEVILISLDFKKPKLVINELNKHKIKLKTFFDPYKHNMQSFGVTIPPASFLIDSRGAILFSTKSKINWDDPDILYKIKRMIQNNFEQNKSDLKKEFLILKEDSGINDSDFNVMVLN